VLTTEPVKESDKFIPDTTELVLTPDTELEMKEKPEAVQEKETLPASEKVTKVLEELDKKESNSNNNKKPEKKAAPKKSKPKKTLQRDDKIANNIVGMINSETIKPLSPNGFSDKD
jgi:hypothetical protein